jgi:group I intron endonuclease
MNTILMTKLLVMLSIMDFLKKNSNIELNFFKIEKVEILTSTYLLKLYNKISTSEIKLLNYLIKLVLLQTSFNKSKEHFNIIDSTHLTRFSNDLIKDSTIMIILKTIYTENNTEAIDFPFLMYDNSLLSKNSILKEINNKSGIYCWYCKPSGNMYVGSGQNLRERVGDYYQLAYIRDREHLPIVRAINKYGMNQFSLIILELCNKQDLISSEQFWIDFINPTYNILTVAASWLGNKHTEEARKKISMIMKNREHTLETKLKISLNRQKENNPFYNRTHTAEAKERMSASHSTRLKDPNPGVQISVFSLENRLLYTFKSIRETARYFKADTRTINRYLNSKILFKNLYFIKSYSTQP